MKKIFLAVIATLSISAFSQQTSNTDNDAVMQDGSGSIDSLESDTTNRGTSTSPGSGATTTYGDQQNMDEELDTSSGTGAEEDSSEMTDEDFRNSEINTPDQWEEE